MFSKNIAALALVLSFSSVAQGKTCEETLTNDYNNDMKVMVVDGDDLDVEFGTAAAAKTIIRTAVATTGCDLTSLQFERQNENFVAKCSEIVRGNNMSKTCYVESNVGYFTITQTMPDDLVVVYSRWD